MIYSGLMSDVKYVTTKKGFNVKSKDLNESKLVIIYRGSIPMNKLTNLLQNIYLNGTPIRSKNKKLNFDQFIIDVDINSGINSQIRIQMCGNQFPQLPTVEFK